MKPLERVDIQTADSLLDFGKRIGGGQRAREQLEGAVALHNLLAEQGVAYLADEVGMGKTYVALGALALFRHFHPHFRVLILAPRENIQAKWMKEFRNFVDHNVRFPDLRVKGLDGRSTRTMVSCGNLSELAYEASLNPNRDFFARMTSFSLPLAGKSDVDAKAAKAHLDKLSHILPWIQEAGFDRRDRDGFKDKVAMAMCCALPVFDLVIVDEGHNLKYGFGGQAARNRVLALCMGREDSGVDSKSFPGYGPRARRVLFLSATPVEESYRQLWNQLDLFGKGNAFKGLASEEGDEEKKKGLAKRFLIRRVTSLHLDGKPHTKNLYRREWRRGGMLEHDNPIRIEDPKQKLVVALVQKKVSELLQHETFNSSFQIGMLASFESFLQTAKVKDDSEGVFDGEQTDRDEEREGLDVADVNRLASSYRKRFGHELPHPKMDALVDALSDAWRTGEKRLVFVRRVASVKEIKRKLDDRYDKWLQNRMLAGLPHLRKELEKIFVQYQEDRLVSEKAWRKAIGVEEDSSDPAGDPDPSLLGVEDTHDTGGNGNFFEWFFRGVGPKGIISGANIQQRFKDRGTTYATFFERNHVADLLQCPAQETRQRLSEALGVGLPELAAGIRGRAKRFLSRGAKKFPRADRFEAAQASAIEWLKDTPCPLQEPARIAWHERFEASLQARETLEAPDCAELLDTPTFFTELAQKPELRNVLWPHSKHAEANAAFREGHLRALLLAATARLGHAFIDLYLQAAGRLKSLRFRTLEKSEESSEEMDRVRIHAYLDLLEGQMARAPGGGDWLAFDELRHVSDHFDLILDVNAPELRSLELPKAARAIGTLLSEQQPIGGMSGQVNKTLVRQFRMPGYPFILVSTDLLQEGEDLHSFCSSVHHYGISWTPSSMEQRIGRIDRVRSHTERRLLSNSHSAPHGRDLLQVHYPFLEDTVEILQVNKVLERMNNFLKLMHEGIVPSRLEDKKVDAGKEFARERRVVPQIREPLVTAFPITPDHLAGTRNGLKVEPSEVRAIGDRFLALHGQSLGSAEIAWEPLFSTRPLMGTIKLSGRIQPFSLVLRSLGSHPVVRCISPIGRTDPEENQDLIQERAMQMGIRLGAIVNSADHSYNLTVEQDVLLPGDTGLALKRVGNLLLRVAKDADRMEHEILPGQDEPLTSFREDLEKDTLGGN